MKKWFKQKSKSEKKAAPQSGKNSLNSLSEYFCSYLAALETVKSSGQGVA